MENNNSVNEVINGLYANAGCDLTSLKLYASDEEAVAAFNGDYVALFQAILDEHVAQGTEVENEYHAIERSRPLTSEENAEANDRLLAIRRDVVRAGEALRAARRFEAITSSGMSVN